MKRFTFYLNVEGSGSDTREAWADAMEKLAEAILRGEYDEPPTDIFGPDDQVPAAEILGGNLDAGFGIDHGEDKP